MLSVFPVRLRPIAENVLQGKRISECDLLHVLNSCTLPQLGILADALKQQKSGNVVYYSRNYHIEPTNVCVYGCSFCAFSVNEKEKGWSLSLDEILTKVNSLDEHITELHIVGGSNPEYDLEFYTRLLTEIHKLKPSVHIRAFTASEIFYLSELSGKTVEEVLSVLIEAGLQSLPGGGAEIFDDEIRKRICSKKISSRQWLDIHRQAHKLGIHTNCTMLYGHLETMEQRLKHLDMLRTLQDETGGFKAFIPLKFRNGNNSLSHIKETSVFEDLKMYAISRIYLDNIQHIKTYLPAYGEETSCLALRFGADELDGTFSTSTQIYSKAGADEQIADMSIEKATRLIAETGYTPVERDSEYSIPENI